MKESMIERVSNLFTARAGAGVDSFFREVLGNLTRDGYTHAFAIFNGTTIEVFDTDSVDSLLVRWESRREGGS